MRSCYMCWVIREFLYMGLMSCGSVCHLWPVYLLCRLYVCEECGSLLWGRALGSQQQQGQGCGLAVPEFPRHGSGGPSGPLSRPNKQLTLMDDSESVTVLWGLAHGGTCEGLLGSAGPPLLPTGGTAAGHIRAQATRPHLQSSLLTDTSLLQRTCPSHLRQSNPWSRSD